MRKKTFILLISLCTASAINASAVEDDFKGLSVSKAGDERRSLSEIIKEYRWDDLSDEDIEELNTRACSIEEKINLYIKLEKKDKEEVKRNELASIWKKLSLAGDIGAQEKYGIFLRTGSLQHPKNDQLAAFWLFTSYINGNYDLESHLKGWIPEVEEIKNSILSMNVKKNEKKCYEIIESFCNKYASVASFTDKYIN